MSNCMVLPGTATSRDSEVPARGALFLNHGPGSSTISKLTTPSYGLVPGTLGLSSILTSK